MASQEKGPERFVESLKQSGLSIYDAVEVGDSELWIPTPDLELLLNNALTGVSLAGSPIRTRSKIAKSHVCKALGYPEPASFTKTQPRFPGQNFDTYVQKQNNLQVWNEDLDPSRRCVIIRLGEDSVIASVKVVTGSRLAELDTTGKLTQKYQAWITTGELAAELATTADTDLLSPFVSAGSTPGTGLSPTDYPTIGNLMPITEVFDRLQTLVGDSVPYIGSDQERNRGEQMHRKVCDKLGYAGYGDTGAFPDVTHQLLEVKLQTSPTIDLGISCPDDTAALGVPSLDGRQVRHCDVRYAVFYGEVKGEEVSLTHLVLTTGELLFDSFPKAQGNVINTKLQIPLPRDFFDDR